MLTMLLIILLKVVLALLLDQFLGEPRRWHPLVGFGRLAQALESAFNHGSSLQKQLLGALAWTLAVLPVTALSALLWLSPAGHFWDVALLYLVIGRKSLFDHSRRVWAALQQQDLDSARHHTGMMVSRETQNLDATGCTRATIESVLENGNDGVIGALFWFALLGAPGAVLFRLVNTLDAMWGYRNERFNDFGRAAARIDDALNFIPARLCAGAYAAAGHWRLALQAWQMQAHLLKSPNGGPVMCAGAGALNLQLGGSAVYHGELLEKPFFGGHDEPQPHDILRANHLLDRATAILLAVFLVAPVALLGALA